MSIQVPQRPIFDYPEVGTQVSSTEKKKERYRVHPDKAAEFFADPNTNAYHADEAAQDWLKTYAVTSKSGNNNPKGLNGRLKLALQAHKKWSDERDIQPLSLSKEVRHDRRMENISGNLDNWGNLFSDEGFDKEIERRGLATSYNELIERGMDKQQVRGNLRRKLFTKDLSGQNDALSQARVSQHILGLEDQSDEAYVSGAQSWVEGKRKYRDEISNARKSAAENFFKREVAVDWGLEAQKKVSSEAADAYLKSSNGFKKQYGDIVPVVRDLVDNMKAEGARGLFEETEEVDVNWGKIMELYGDYRRDDFLYVLGKISEQEEVNVDGFIARNAKGMSRTVERMAKAGMRLIDQVKTEASGVSNESLRDRQWNQFQADIADLKGNVARIEASNDFEKIANFTTASLPYMVFAATGVGTGLIAATEAQGFSENMRAENPNLTYAESMKVALPAGAVYAGIEKLQVGGLLGKFPGMQGVVNKFTSGKPLGSWVRRVAATTLYEYGQETFQDAVEPLSRDIANQFKDEVPEGDWSTFEVVSKDRFLGVIGLSVLGGTGQWARDRFTQQEVKEELQDKFSLQLTGATVEEANEIAKMAEKDPDAALQQYKKTVFSKPVEERKEISEAAIKSAEDAVATGVLDGLPVVTSNEGGGFVVDFKDGTKKTVESREEAQIAIDQRMEENFLDSAQAVRDRMDNLLETSEGDNKAEIAKPRTFQELADLRVETVERLKEAVAVSFMQRGEAVPENIDLNNYTEQGSVTLRRKMAGFAVRLAKDEMTLPSTVDEEFSEGFLRMIVEQGETTFDDVKTMLDEFGAIAGIDMTQGYDVDPNRAVIEGFSKFAKAYMLQGDHKSIPKSSQAWYRKAWRVLENPDSVPAPLRAFAELVTKLLRSVFDVAQAIRSQKQDGEGINPELESLAMRALGLNEQQIAEEAQAKATKEIQEELGLAPEADADPTFSIGNTTVTPNADTKTYPTKDGGVVGPASFSITAHHGTPHKVDRFSTENIGTGEGAQAYGWGLYFAESEDVARGYKSRLTDWNSAGVYSFQGEQYASDDFTSPERHAIAHVFHNGIESARKLSEVLLQDARNGEPYTEEQGGLPYYEKLAETVESIQNESDITFDQGSLYTVELNVEQDELLDWDKPLSEQSERVREAVSIPKPLTRHNKKEGEWAAYIDGVAGAGFGLTEKEAIDKFSKKVSGRAAYSALGNPQEASEALAAAGIKGIRYLDGDSRADGEGTSNYVIFDDADIKITEENGQVVDTSSPSFSITPAQDAEYLAAVESGDVETQQNLVDQVAQKAGFTIGPVYHGTDTEFTTFDVEVGAWFATDRADAVEFSEKSAEGEAGSARVVSAYLNPGRVFVIPQSIDMSEEISAQEALEIVNEENGTSFTLEQIGYGAGPDADYVGNAYEFFGNSGYNFVKTAKAAGFDVVSAWDMDEQHYAALYPQNIKSADPVTRDDAGNVIPLSQRFDQSRDEISFSITPAQDAEYMELAKNPEKNRSLLQKLVDEAAKAAGYLVGPVYHGSKSPDIQVFDPGAHSLPNSIDAIGTWFTTEESQTKRYAFDATTYRQALKMDNPLTFELKNVIPEMQAGQLRKLATRRAMLEDNAEGYGELSFQEQKESRKFSGEISKQIDELDAQTRENEPFYALMDTWRKFHGGEQFGDPQAFVKHLKSKGYDGIHLHNTLADFGREGTEYADWYIAFDSNQSKSADPVTYDADGNVIPLSQRFDQSRDEISFSITPKEIREAKEPIVEQIYLKETEKFKQGVESGRIKTDSDIRDFIGKHMVMHQPDTAMAGEVRVDGESFVKGKGGVYYPVLFSEEGYFWASTAAKADEMAGALNEISERNGGSIYMALTSADVDKLFSSTTMSVGTMNFFKRLATNPRKYGITEAQLNKMLIEASKTQIVSKLLIKGKDGKPVLNEKGEKTYKVKTQEFGHTLSKGSKLNQTMQELEGWLQPFNEDKSTGSSFDVRKSFVFDLMRQVSAHLKGKPAQSKAVASLLTQESNEFAKNKVIKGDLSLAAFTQGLGDMLSEPLTKTFQQFGSKGKGYIYAVIEIEGKVKAIDTKGHESYPKAIVSAEGKLPTVHVMKEGYHWTDVVQEKDSGARVERVTKEMNKVYPTGGFSAYKGRPLQFGDVQENAEGVELSFSITPKDEKMSEAVDQIFNGGARFAEFSDKVRKKKEEILARHREQYNKAESESERAIIEVESLAQAEGLYMALPSSMKAIRSEIEEVAELIVERRSGVDSLKMKEDEGLRSVVLPFKLPEAVSEFRIIKALRINLTARGRLTREQHKIKMAAEATQLAELKEAEQVVARLRKQIRKTVKGEIPRDMLMRQAQEVATGDAKMDTLPKEIQPIVQEAREQVDRLSQKMIDSGIAKGDLAKVFERQMGNYLNRSYRRFTRPESWEKEVPQEARDAAKEYLRKELPADAYTPGVSKDEQLDGYVDNLLKDSVSGSMMDSMTALLGQKHLGNLIGRKSIPKPIRDLWGEYKRLDENYLNSVRKMAGQVASHSILEDFKKDGLGDLIFDKPRKGYATQVTAEGNEALAPLDGYYVSEEMAQALKDFAELGKKEIGTWLKWWLKFNSTAKVSKTIYNPTTHARNFFSNFGYVLANDNFFEYARSGKDSAVINFKEIFGFARTPEIEDRIRYYVRLGIMHQGAVSQEFKDILKDFSAGEVDIEEYSQKKLLKIAKAPLGVIQAAYQAEDDFHKIVAFESEKRKLAKHKKNWSQEKIDREAAQIIRDTMPDYSQVPTAVKALRRVPLVGTFTSFTAEVLRNNHNIIARAITEMKDPDLKVVGIRRMSFFMMAHAVPVALAAFLKELFDVEDEEDEATRAIAAPWDKDSLLMYVGRSPSGDPKYANFSYTDPFSIFKTPFIISQREGLSATSITKGVMKGLEPFYGVEIGTKALIETFEGEDDLGRKISNDNDDVLTQTKDRAIHLLKALEPGFLRTGERIRRAYTGEKTPSGKEFDLATEIGAVITGQRVTTVRRQDAVKYRTWEFTDDKRNASTNFNKAWRDGEADRESLTKAVEDYRRDTKLAFEGYQDVLRAVSVLGLSDDEILAAGYDNPTTPTAKIAQSLLDAKVGETPIPEKKFSKSHLKEIREIEGREKLLRELIPEAF